MTHESSNRIWAGEIICDPKPERRQSRLPKPARESGRWRPSRTPSPAAFSLTNATATKAENSKMLPCETSMWISSAVQAISRGYKYHFFLDLLERAKFSFYRICHLKRLSLCIYIQHSYLNVPRSKSKYLEDTVGVANCAHAVKLPRVDPVGVAIRIRVAHVVDRLQPLELAR